MNQTKNHSITTLKLFNFSLYGSIAVIMTFFPLYFQSVGISEVEIGWLMGSGPFISMIANPIWGYFSDRSQNIKRMLLIMLIGNVIIIQFVFHTQQSMIYWIFFLMVLFYFFQTPLFTQSNTLILNAIEGTSVKFGAIRYTGSLGYGVMAFLAGPMITFIGMNRLWLIYTLFIIITLCLWIPLPRGNVASVSSVQQGDFKALLLQNKYFLAFLLIGIVISIPNMINQMFISLYMDQLGGSLTIIGFSAFASAFLEIPVFLWLDKNLKGNTKTMFGMLVFVSMLYVVRWVLMSLATSPMQIIFVQFLHAISFGGYFYIGTLLTARLIPAHVRSSGQALYTLSSSGISGVIAGLIGGRMFQQLGASGMYMTMSLISLIGAFGIYYLWRKIGKIEGKLANK